MSTEATPADAPELSANEQVVANFEQAATEMGVMAAPEPPPTDTDPGDETERARDEQGRFTAEPVAVEEPSAAQLDGLSASAQAYLERYGGDTQKALDAAAHHASLVGKQGSELGELRSVKEELQQLRQELGQPEAVQMDAETVGWIEANPGNALAWAEQNQQPAVWQQALAELRVQDPAAYADKMIDLRMADLEQRMQAQLAPAQQNLDNQTYGLALQDASRDHPELLTPGFIERALQHPGMQHLNVTALSTGTAPERAGVLRTIAALAGTWGIAPASSAPSPASEQVAAAATNGLAPADSAPVAPAQALDPRVTATVATGGFAPSREAPTAVDSFHARFEQIAREQGAMPPLNE